MTGTNSPQMSLHRRHTTVRVTCLRYCIFLRKRRALTLHSDMQGPARFKSPGLGSAWEGSVVRTKTSPSIALVIQTMPREHEHHRTRLAHGTCEALRPAAAHDCADVRLWPGALAAQTWRGVLHMRPVSTSSIARELSTACTACVRRCDPPALMIVLMFASGLWLPELGVACSTCAP